jgi:Arc/MetJ-type ribon-helix-helix transcriptional regulator
MPDSESFLVTVPMEWKLEKYATDKRRFPSVQDFIRELVRRDIETIEKEALERQVTMNELKEKK